MSPIEQIKKLIDRGQYLEAASLADESKISDCRNISRNLEPILDIDNSIKESLSMVSSIEDRIKGYESELRSVEDAVYLMEEREQADKNSSNICELIEELIENLVIPDHVQRTLLDGNMDGEQIKEALDTFERTLGYKPHPTLHEMRVVQDQRMIANSIKSKFCDKFYDHFSQNVEHKLSEYSEVFINIIYSQAKTLPDHDVIHELSYLSPITHWIRRNDRSTYQALKDFYTGRLKTQYDNELKIFFECAKERMINPNSWDELYSYFEDIFQAVEPACLKEQRFYIDFFQASEDSDLTDRLLYMFNQLRTELLDFADYYTNQNGLYSLYILVGLSKHDPIQCGFLTQIYSEVLIRVKRKFDNYMELQLHAIRECKVPKQTKCGVIAGVKNFEQFATQVELLVKSSGDRRNDVDRWYPELVKELFITIDGIEHSRTPPEMIRLENYNYLHDVLRSKKIPCLETQTKEASVLYKAALDAYVKRYFGKPLKKLNVFFDGVEAKKAQGVKEEEISFQLAFSKQELRKVLQMVTLKEVRKGLEEMYKRIEKHVYDPHLSNSLIQVIWRAMQGEFLEQYKAIKESIERCYPSTNLSLTFTIDDVLQVFSAIAQAH